LVSHDYATVKFFAPFESFDASPLPSTFGVYRDYRKMALKFVNNRNRRILGDLARRRRA